MPHHGDGVEIVPEVGVVGALAAAGKEIHPRPSHFGDSIATGARAPVAIAAWRPSGANEGIEEQ